MSFDRMKSEGRRFQARSQASALWPFPRALPLLVGAMLLSLGSSSTPKRESVEKSGPFRSQADKDLGHPAVLLKNKGPSAMALALVGPSQRVLTVAPHSTFRTLILAGTYRYKVTCLQKGCGRKDRTGVVQLRRRTRYVLRLK